MENSSGADKFMGSPPLFLPRHEGVACGRGQKCAWNVAGAWLAGTLAGRPAWPRREPLWPP